MKVPRHLLLAALSLSCAPPAGSSTSPAQAVATDATRPGGLEAALNDAALGVQDQALGGLLRDHWRWRLERSPVHATELGVHDFDDRLADLSLAAEERGRAERKDLLRRARAIDVAGLNAGDTLSLRMFIEELEHAEQGEVCEYSKWNLSARDNPVTAMNRLPQVHALESSTDAANLLARYRQIPAQIDARIEKLRVGAEAGFFANTESTRRVIEMAARQLADPLAGWPIVRPETAKIDAWTNEDRERFGRELVALAEAEIRPALRRWHDFLRDEILPSARDEAHSGLAALPFGEACYQAMIRRYTTLPLSAEEIHTTGQREMARINDEMRQLGAKLFGTRDLAEILRRLRSDPDLYFSTEAQVEAFAAESLAAAKAKMPEYFGRLPVADCVVTRVPAYEAPFTTIAYYEPAFPDGSKPGEYFINTTKPSTRPRYEARVLAHHEAIPGHHLQVAIAQELPAVPAFRRHGGRTVFVEGWALYTERLSDEMGLYQDDLDRMGVLSFDAWRAGRLVVDTGIHAMGWSRKRAIDYLLQHSALAPNNIDNEVDRYISWPGQAVAYKIGQLEISRLRSEAERKLGERFDIKAFHDVVLEAGAVSVDVLRERVGAWVEGRAAG